MALIEREHLMSKISSLRKTSWFSQGGAYERYIRNGVIETVEQLCVEEKEKTAFETKEVTHGHWEEVRNQYAGCSACKSVFKIPDVVTTLCDLPMYESGYEEFKAENPFCRKCGAKMDEVISCENNE